ncbi:hypothetical protein L6452_18481 [Arctium lappa]|uniref:Uncharacterized protein n=1 Tax=Arctium lappa TaxID=4217 RepID=A0ACB9C665_ARCLA|nr:hypothetical protein L6452_18481 [Arctium lappa]
MSESEESMTYQEDEQGVSSALTYINTTLPHKHIIRSHPKENMGDLRSIPYFTTIDAPSSISCPRPHFSYSMDMNNTVPFHDHSPLHSDDLSSGYLEDALLEFSSKRRRLLLFHDDQHQPINQTSFPGYWNSLSPQDFDNSYESFCKFYADNNAAVFSGENRRRVEETYSTSSSESNKSSNHTHCFSAKQTLLSSHHSLAGRNEERKKKVVTRVVYPFALVKPGGFKGDITLNDINKRILMPPTRPLKHPVGDFACRPLVSPDGFGLSGKEVVALTRIHTQGRGTITIIRTKN